MSKIDEYLEYLNDFVPFVGGVDTSKHGTYKRATSVYGRGKIKVDDEEEVEEYTSYNPNGSGYGMMLQRWNLSGSSAGGTSSPVQSAPSSQKNVKSDIVVKIKKLKKKSKKKRKD